MTCPSLENGDTFTQSEFIQRLTHNCRYDRLSRPTNIIPLNVFTQLYIYHLEAAAGHDLVIITIFDNNKPFILTGFESR